MNSTKTITYLRACHGAERFFRGPPQFLELKQMAELEDRFRARSRAALRLYRQWKHDCHGIEDPVERHYRLLEGMLLHRQAQEATRLYGIIRKDMRRSFHKYIALSLKH